jgi:hypothetical protein
MFDGVGAENMSELTRLEWQMIDIYDDKIRHFFVANDIGIDSSAIRFSTTDI